MAEVNVAVNGRSYPIGCDDGEEAQVQRLSGLVDARVRELAALVGQVGEARLLLMAALTMADDLEGAQRELTALKEANRNDAQAGFQARADVEAGSQALLSMARRLEEIAGKLEAP